MEPLLNVLGDVAMGALAVLAIALVGAMILGG